MWTNTSLPPSSGCMKPYPLSGLSHFTVPVVIEAILRIVEKNRRPSMWTPMLYRGFEEEVVSRRKKARPSRRQKHDTPQCMFLSRAKQGGSSVFERGQIAPACSILLSFWYSAPFSLEIRTLFRMMFRSEHDPKKSQPFC